MPASTHTCWKSKAYSATIVSVALFTLYFIPTKPGNKQQSNESWGAEHRAVRTKQKIKMIRTRMFIARKSYLRITRGIVFSAQRLTCEIRSPTKRTHWFNTKVHTLHSCTNHDSSSCKRCNKYETRMTFSTTRGRSWPWSITILLKKPFHMLALLADRLCTIQRRKCPKHGAEHKQVSSVFLSLFLLRYLLAISARIYT